MNNSTSARGGRFSSCPDEMVFLVELLRLRAFSQKKSLKMGVVPFRKRFASEKNNIAFAGKIPHRQQALFL